MAIYEPPKKTATGGIMTGAGAGMMAIGGGLTTTGVGAAVGIPLMAVGALTSVAGTIINGNQEERSQKYEAQYANRIQGENNLQASYQNNLQQGRASYTQSGVSSSIAAINGMLNPASSNIPSNGGTGFSNQRLT